MSSKRIGRISEEIKRVVSNTIRTELKDPRVSTMTSVTAVEVTRDLSYATIYLSILGNEDEQKNTLSAMSRASSFIRKEISSKLKLRHTPELIFKIDKSIEHGMYMTKLIEKIKKGDNHDS